MQGMMAMVMQFLPLQMIMGMFGGGKSGGFSMSKMMNMMMMMSMLPMIMKMMPGQVDAA